jgi:hypothetical protein
MVLILCTAKTKSPNKDVGAPEVHDDR